MADWPQFQTSLRGAAPNDLSGFRSDKQAVGLGAAKVFEAPANPTENHWVEQSSTTQVASSPGE